MDDKGIDELLVKKAQDGNKVAFDALVIKYQSRLLHLVYHYIHDPSEAKDVVQDAFIKAYKALPEFRSHSTFYTWLYRIAVNTAKNHLTYLGRRPPNVDIDVEVAELYDFDNKLNEYANPETYLISDEVQHALLKTIATLPPELKTAITLREIAGLSYEEIAKMRICKTMAIFSQYSLLCWTNIAAINMLAAI